MPPGIRERVGACLLGGESGWPPILDRDLASRDSHDLALSFLLPFERLGRKGVDTR